LSAADPKHVWVAGGDGTVLRMLARDTGAIQAAQHTTDLRAALLSAGIGTALAGQPLIDFANADADLTERSARIEKARSALAAAPPEPAPRPEAGTEMPGPNRFHDPAFLAAVNRAGITVFVLGSALILGAIVRRAMRLTTQLDACADALTLCRGTVDARFHDLMRALSPSGQLPRDLLASQGQAVSPIQRL
jgi:hypothetical protein